MKQRDLMIIAGVVVASAILSFIISSEVITTPSGRQQQVQVVPPISGTLPKTDSAYFNGNSIDPTKLVQVSNNSNQAPFNSSAQ